MKMQSELISKKTIPCQAKVDKSLKALQQLALVSISHDDLNAFDDSDENSEEANSMLDTSHLTQDFEKMAPRSAAVL